MACKHGGELQVVCRYSPHISPLDKQSEIHRGVCRHNTWVSAWAFFLLIGMSFAGRDRTHSLRCKLQSCILDSLRKTLVPSAKQCENGKVWQQMMREHDYRFIRLCFFGLALSKRGRLRNSGTELNSTKMNKNCVRKLIELNCFFLLIKFERTVPQSTT